MADVRNERLLTRWIVGKVDADSPDELDAAAKLARAILLLMALSAHAVAFLPADSFYTMDRDAGLDWDALMCRADESFDDDADKGSGGKRKGGGSKRGQSMSDAAWAHLPAESYWPAYFAALLRPGADLDDARAMVLRQQAGPLALRIAESLLSETGHTFAVLRSELTAVAGKAGIPKEGILTAEGHTPTRVRAADISHEDVAAAARADNTSVPLATEEHLRGFAGAVEKLHPDARALFDKTVAKLRKKHGADVAAVVEAAARAAGAEREQDAVLSNSLVDGALASSLRTVKAALAAVRADESGGHDDDAGHA